MIFKYFEVWKVLIYSVCGIGYVVVVVYNVGYVSGVEYKDIFVLLNNLMKLGI